MCCYKKLFEKVVMSRKKTTRNCQRLRFYSCSSDVVFSAIVIDLSVCLSLLLLSLSLPIMHITSLMSIIVDETDKLSRQ